MCESRSFERETFLRVFYSFSFSSFFFFLGVKRKGEQNNFSCCQNACLFARSSRRFERETFFQTSFLVPF